MLKQSTGDRSPPPRPLTKYETTARALGERFLALVRPIRVIDSVRWDDSIGRDFLAAGGRNLPRINRESYAPLAFDPARKRWDLLELERETARRLGRTEPLGRLLRRRCRQARGSIGLLQCRGTPEFAALARQLYSAATPTDDRQVEAVFAALAVQVRPTTDGNRHIDAGVAAGILAARLGKVLATAGRFRVRLSDTLVSDAAVSGRSIKLRRSARFGLTDLALLAVHEGWVHVGTALNAQRQLMCKFLGHGPPATTAGQEGLAVVCELMAGVSHHDRIHRLFARYRAVRMADAGADFRDVYRFFLRETGDPHAAYRQAVRIFRGSLPAGAGPFPKDATYALGLLRLLQTMRRHPSAQVSLLFSGKTGLTDLPLLRLLHDAGHLAPPVFVPPPFDDAAVLKACLNRLPHPPHGLPRPHLAASAAPAAPPLPPDTEHSTTERRSFSLLAASDSLSFD